MMPVWVLGILGLILITFGILTWLTKKTNRRTPEEVASYIENFVNGTGGPWDWDDFISCPITDDELDAVRIECIRVEEEHPSAGKGWCNEEGMRVMLALAKRLREKNGH